MVWCRCFVLVIEVEQVKLCLRLVMDHTSVLCSRFPPGAEEPPCFVTLIRQSVSSPILLSGIFPGRRGVLDKSKVMKEGEELAA